MTVEEKICDAGIKEEEAFNLIFEKTYIKSFDVKQIYDWYKITTSANYSNYRFVLENISIDNAGGWGNLQINVYDEFGLDMGYTGDIIKGSTGFLDLHLEENKTYTIRISRRNADHLGNYKLTIEEKICDAGDNKEGAFPIALNETHNGVFDVSNNDWYAHKFTEGGTYSFSFTNHNINTDLYMAIHDSFSEICVKTARKGETTTFLLEITQDTILYIGLSRRNSQENGTYSITIVKQ